MEINEHLPPKEPQPFKVTIGTATRPSPEHPERNEDSIINVGEKNVAGVADGVGGHGQGNIASKFLKKHIETLVQTNNFTSPEAFFAIIKQALGDYRTDMTNFGRADSTLTVGWVFEKEGNRLLALAAAGDSRAYALHGDGSFEQISKDQNVVNDVFDQYPEIAKFVNDAMDNGETVRDVLSDQNKAALHTLWEATNPIDRQNILDKISKFLSTRNIHILLTEPLLDHFWLTRNVIAHGTRGDYRHGNLTETVQFEVVPLAGGIVGLEFGSDGGSDTLSLPHLTSIGKSIDLTQTGFAQPLAREIVDTAYGIFLDPKQKNPPNAQVYRTKPDDVTAVVMELPQ